MLVCKMSDEEDLIKLFVISIVFIHAMWINVGRRIKIGLVGIVTNIVTSMIYLRFNIFTMLKVLDKSY